MIDLIVASLFCCFSVLIHVIIKLFYC